MSMLNMVEVDKALASGTGGVNIQIQTVNMHYNRYHEEIALFQFNLSDTASEDSGAVGRNNTNGSTILTSSEGDCPPHGLNRRKHLSKEAVTSTTYTGTHTRNYTTDSSPSVRSRRCGRDFDEANVGDRLNNNGTVLVVMIILFCMASDVTGGRVCICANRDAREWSTT